MHNKPLFLRERSDEPYVTVIIFFFSCFRYLPVVELQEDDEEASIKEVENSIASSLKIKTTSYSAFDKVSFCDENSFVFKA